MDTPRCPTVALLTKTRALLALVWLGAATAPGCMTDDPLTGALLPPAFERDADPLDRLFPGASDAALDADEDDLPSDGGGPDLTDAVTDVEVGDRCVRNGQPDPGEECDDDNTSNDDFCLNNCRLACGDGVRNAVERCDIAIPVDAEDACPSGCDDGQACTADVLSGADCDAHCVHQPITARVNDDGCCPAGAGPATDSDCGGVCGNGVVEPPAESCDTALEPNQPGACPSVCTDALACTADQLLDPGTCRARCRFVSITEIGPDDGCCPTSGTPETDPNCEAACGNGTVDPPNETCDTALEAGQVGACPTTCPSDQECLVRELVGAGTCTAACSDTFITAPGDDDGCCPPTGNANNDPDCEPNCGNGVPEEGEECDDGPGLPSDTCDAFCHLLAPPPTAFRFDSILLRAPHVFADIPFLGCQDATGTVNGLINDAVTQDGDDDGLLDLSVMLVFRPLVQVPPGGELDVALGECSTDGPLCTFDPDVTPQRADYTNSTTGTCLAPTPGTFAVYFPGITPVTATTAPCFVTANVSLTLEFGGVQLPLEDTAVAANYAGNPAASLENGLLRGFMSEAAANAVVLPADLPVVGGQTLASILPGATDCSTRDERVTNGPPAGSTTGWWFYLNFTAEGAELVE